MAAKVPGASAIERASLVSRLTFSWIAHVIVKANEGVPDRTGDILSQADADALVPTRYLPSCFESVFHKEYERQKKGAAAVQEQQHGAEDLLAADVRKPHHGFAPLFWTLVHTHRRQLLLQLLLAFTLVGLR